jgi:hypothetical protein
MNFYHDENLKPCKRFVMRSARFSNQFQRPLLSVKCKSVWDSEPFIMQADCSQRHSRYAAVPTINLLHQRPYSRLGFGSCSSAVAQSTDWFERERGGGCSVRAVQCWWTTQSVTSISCVTNCQNEHNSLLYVLCLREDLILLKSEIRLSMFRVVPHRNHALKGQLFAF